MPSDAEHEWLSNYLGKAWGRMGNCRVIYLPSFALCAQALPPGMVSLLGYP